MAGRLVKFVSGSLVGAGIGTACAVLFAPQSGDELKAKLEELGRLARLAGARAQAETEAALIARFRERVDDPTALSDLENTGRFREAATISRTTVVEAPPRPESLVATSGASKSPAPVPVRPAPTPSPSASPASNQAENSSTAGVATADANPPLRPAASGQFASRPPLSNPTAHLSDGPDAKEATWYQGEPSSSEQSRKFPRNLPGPGRE